MCLSPIRIRVRSKVLDLQGGQSYWTEVPCGHCAECLQCKRDAAQYRAWYEAKSTMEDGGYVLFDTLTYDSENLPHISDCVDINELNEQYGFSIDSFNGCNFMCFNKKDIIDFFKRLRRQLQYYGFKSRDCFRYFLTSEYGSDDRYTHRPHYHLLFYVKDHSLPPTVLSSLIGKCWQHGRTDGCPFKREYYVLSNCVFGFGLGSSDMLECQKTCSYVGKYITKDSHFEREIKRRVNYVMSKLFSLEWCLKNGLVQPDRLHLDWSPELWKEKMIKRQDFTAFCVEKSDDVDIVCERCVMTWKQVKKVYDSVLRACSQFHLQSNGFGEAMLRYNKLADVLESGRISIPDSKRGIKFMALPRYYALKMFYEQKVDFNGHKYFALNQLGKDFRLSRLIKSEEYLTQRLEDWRESMKNHNYYSEDMAWYEQLMSRFEQLNDGRSMRDFARYLLYYRGRIKSKAQRIREYKGIFVVDDLNTWVTRFYSGYDENSQLLYHYVCPSDDDHGLHYVCSDEWLGDAEFWKKYDIGYIDVQKRLETAFSFESSHVITDKSDKRFVHYDEMFNLYRSAQDARAKFKQEGFDNEEEIKFKLKSIFARGSSGFEWSSSSQPSVSEEDIRLKLNEIFRVRKLVE